MTLYFANNFDAQFLLRPTASRSVRRVVERPSGAHEQGFVTVGHLQSFCGVPFLARGRACNVLVQLAVTLEFKCC
jgi:hypothetical protein